MRMLYPGRMQFPVGVITGVSLCAAGATLWHWEPLLAGAALAVAFAGCIGSAFLTTREG